MIPFTLGPHKFELPQDYGELTFKQFYAIRESKGGMIELLSILSGLPGDVWEQVKDIDIDAKLTPYLEWMNKPFNGEYFIMPDRIKIDGAYYDIPNDIRLKTFGQKLALQSESQLMAEQGKTDVDLFAYALAIYLQPIYYNEPFKSERLEEFLPLVMECKIEEGYPVAAFFLSNYLRSLQSKKRSFLTILHRKKSEQALAASVNSKSLEQFTPWRRALIRTSNRFSRWITTLYSLPSGTKGSNQNTKRSLTR